MGTGAITEYIDVAQLVLYVFWAFFFALIFYLRREDKREGYPLDSDRSESIRVEGFPGMPRPKTFALPHGGTYVAPNEAQDTRPLAAKPAAPWPGAPLVPTGNPMVDGVGPAAYAQRHDVPDVTIDGDPRIVPMRVATDFSVAERCPDPIGMDVVGLDGKIAGRVRDIWVDRSEPQARYLEVGVYDRVGDAEVRRALLPVPLTQVDERQGLIRVVSITAAQFHDAPRLRNPDRVTLLEEDKICAYYASGHLYATSSRQEPRI